MDDLDILRRCIAAPNELDAAMNEAVSRSPAAARTRSQAQGFDHTLEQTLRTPPVPDGLQGRIMLRVGLAQRRRRRRFGAGLALAASLVLAIGLSLRPVTPPATGFGELALAHVHEELSHLEHASGPVSPGTARALFREVGARVTGDLGALRFAFICPTPQGPGLHLVADAENGPVTVLFVPEASAPTQWQSFADARFRGQMRGYERGALAIIGEDARMVAQIAGQFERNVDWQPRQARGDSRPADARWTASVPQIARTQT